MTIKAWVFSFVSVNKTGDRGYDAHEHMGCRTNGRVDGDDDGLYILRTFSLFGYAFDDIPVGEFGTEANKMRTRRVGTVGLE